MIADRSTRLLMVLTLLVTGVPWNAAGQQTVNKPVQAAPLSVKNAAVSSASRLTTRNADKRYASDRISSGGSPSGYICETHNNFTSCECKGALDCFKLADSGKCDGGTWWEDGNDPSVGGCDFDDP